MYKRIFETLAYYCHNIISIIAVLVGIWFAVLYFTRAPVAPIQKEASRSFEFRGVSMKIQTIVLGEKTCVIVSYDSKAWPEERFSFDCSTPK